MGKKQNALVTVIVPAYNMEAYLEQSLAMLTRQSYSEIEIIVIDDGSADRTYEISKRFEGSDPRVISLQKKNGGAASARNEGIRHASGDFITFVDADDCIPENYVELLMDIAVSTGADIAMSGYRKFFDETSGWKEPAEYLPAQTRIYSSQEALELLLYRRILVNSPWPKLIRKEIMEDIPFPEGKLYEDLAIVYRLFDRAKKLAYNPAAGYYYLQRSGSSMHSEFREQKWDLMEISKELYDFMNKNYPDLAHAADSRFFISNLQMLRELPWEKKYQERFRTVRKNLKRIRKTVLLDQQNSKSTRILALCSYLPLRMLRALGKLYDYVINHLKIRLKY